MKIVRRKSIRLQGFDYSKPGFYFITKCSKNLECFFGDIRIDTFYPNDRGEAVLACWFDIPKHYPNVILHAFSLMPNHLHGIIEISGSKNDVQSRPKEGNQSMPQAGNQGRAQEGFIGRAQEGFIGRAQEGFKGRAQEGFIGRAQDIEPLRHNQFQKIIPGSLGAIVRGFEIGVTKWFRSNTPIHDVWQRNFYDTIIKSNTAYNRISKYIQENPKYWTRDRFYKPRNP